MLELARLLEIPLAVQQSSSVDFVNDNWRDGFEFFDVAAFIIDTNTVTFTKETQFEVVGFNTFEISADLIFPMQADDENFDMSGSEAIVDQVYEVIHNIPNYDNIELKTDRLILEETGDELFIGYSSVWEFTYLSDNAEKTIDEQRLQWQQIYKWWENRQRTWNVSAEADF